MDILDLCARVLASLSLSSEEENMIIDDEYNNRSFIARMIRKKMEVFDVPVQIPDKILMLIELCTDSNPGYSQVMLKEIIGKNAVRDKVLSGVDFAMAYPMAFPILEKGFSDYFEKLWDAQKDELGRNRCDTVEWWTECFERGEENGVQQI